MEPLVELDLEIRLRSHDLGLQQQLKIVLQLVEALIDRGKSLIYSRDSTLEPLLLQQVGRFFLPWSDANARAVASGAEQFEVSLAGEPWEQKPQKYHARSLAELRRKYAAAAGNVAGGAMA